MAHIPLIRMVAIALLGGLLAALAVPALANPDPVQQHNSTAIWFENWIGLSNATLVIAAPDGRVTEIRATSGTPVFELDRAAAPDGVYRYELRAATEERRKIVNPIDQGRGDAQRDTAAVPFYDTGFFVVERGVIVPPDITAEEEAG